MITVVDRNAGQIVQKVTKPNGAVLRYQTAPESVLKGEGDATLVKVYVSLADARQAIGKTVSGKVVG